MKEMKRIVLGAAMVLIVAFGALAQDQKKGDQKPPPKENPPPKVRVEDKKPPPSNNGQGNQGKGDKGGKP